MRSRKLTVAAGAAAMLMSLAACGGGESTSADGKVSLTYGVWDVTQVPTVKKIIAAFEKKNPKIEVTVQQTPYEQYFTKLQTAAGGGQAPDVFWMNGPNFQLYASNGMLEPLSSLKTDTSVYPESLVDLYTYKDELYGLPKDMDTVGLWYNKKLFDAAGVDYPDSDWTWSDFQQAAKKLTDPAEDVYGIGATLTGQEGWYDTIAQAGGSVISADGKKSGYGDARTIEGLKFWTDLIDDKVSPTLKQMTDTQPIDMFESGKIAMFWGGSWDAVRFDANDAIKDSVDVSVLPEGEKRATVIHGVANVVSAKSSHKTEAEKFEQFLGSKEAAEIAASTGTVIPAYDGTQDAWLKAHPKLHLQNFLDQLDYAVPLPVSGNTAAWNTLELAQLTKAWNGSEPVDKAAKELAKQMDAALAKEQG
ncbi:ABC transporter substrate-binding protein [Streptomyces sp. NPDC059785]|uniref:ABC transporter substrate-binding protein n=1 Tax=unclassified Streptomyces TaxID=2593676 RepID=UPI00364E8252